MQTQLQVVVIFNTVCLAILSNTVYAATPTDKFWLGPNYRGTHSTSRGLGSLLSIVDKFPRELNANFKVADGYQFAFFDAISGRSEHPKALELGCGEGRAAGQLAAKYPSWSVYCFNLKGYKQRSRGRPIGRGTAALWLRARTQPPPRCRPLFAPPKKTFLRRPRPCRPRTCQPSPAG